MTCGQLEALISTYLLGNLAQGAIKAGSKLKFGVAASSQNSLVASDARAAHLTPATAVVRAPGPGTPGPPGAPPFLGPKRPRAAEPGAGLVAASPAAIKGGRRLGLSMLEVLADRPGADKSF